MDTQPAAQVAFNYASPPARPSPRTVEAMLLCTPGLLCGAWFVVIWFWPGGISELMLGIFWVLWFLVIVAAIVSVIRYTVFVRVFSPAIIFNLTVNVAGLLFSVVGLLGGV